VARPALRAWSCHPVIAMSAPDEKTRLLVRLPAGRGQRGLDLSGPRTWANSIPKSPPKPASQG
jgi:hypothetical protein